MGTSVNMMQETEQASKAVLEFREYAAKLPMTQEMVNFLLMYCDLSQEDQNIFYEKVISPCRQAA